LHRVGLLDLTAVAVAGGDHEVVEGGAVGRVLVDLDGDGQVHRLVDRQVADLPGGLVAVDGRRLRLGGDDLARALHGVADHDVGQGARTPVRDRDVVFEDAAGSD